MVAWPEFDPAPYAFQQWCSVRGAISDMLFIPLVKWTLHIEVKEIVAHRTTNEWHWGLTFEVRGVLRLTARRPLD